MKIRSTESPPAESTTSSRLVERIRRLFQSDATNQTELIDTLQRAHERDLMDRDSFDTMQRVLQVSDLQARDIMIPRPNMVVLDREGSPEDYLPTVIESAHSRFPVIEDDRDHVVGILLAKDLLRFFGKQAEEFNLRDIMRPAVYIPESKRLNQLLSEFREKRNHMAIVVDEYGGAAGLVTIEDVLEQIVGNIEDEHDHDDEEQMITQRVDDFVIKALCPVEDFNRHFDTNFDDEDSHTIGGLVLSEFGRMPAKGDSLTLDGHRFEVLNVDSRRVHLLRLTLEEHQDVA